MILSKKLLFAPALLLITLFLIITTRHEDLEELLPTAFTGPEVEKSASKSSAHVPCNEDLSWLDVYDFSSPFNYASRRISTNYVSEKKTEPFTVIETPLFPALRELNLTKTRYLSPKSCDEPIVLEVLAPPEPVNASNMIFGMQTTIQRLSETIIHLSRWLPKTGAHLIVIVIESEGIPASEDQIRLVQRQLEAAGIFATVTHPETPEDTFPQRYFSLLNIMHGYRTPETEWLVLMDDDTFIPSMPALLKTLKEHDASKPQYLGGLSEDWGSVNMYGLMAFGGAGIFLSVPLTDIITSPKIYEVCKNDRTSSAGDVTTRRCIYNHTPYKLTHIPSLHQMDIAGDVSGIFESGRQLLTFHHWKGWFGPLPVEKMHLVSDFCDAEDCFLRRWQFEDKFVLTNGYSLSQYPLTETISVGKEKSWFWGKTKEEMEMEEDEEMKPLHVKSYIGDLDLEKMEKTWNGNDHMQVDHSLEPTRPGLELGKEKLLHQLIDAVKVGEEIRQVYFRDGGLEELDTVLVLYWTQGTEPRSQEVIE